VALCGEYKVGGYPTLRLAAAGQLLARDLNASSLFGNAGMSHDAKGVVQWIQKELGM
jgi:hypothetical protein